MAFLGILKPAFICFNVLAWPLLAVVYPLWVSIGAIEADNSSECRKLVAYWVLFSLIFLFEQAFHNLLVWLPFWLYMKLLITWWLVMPDFDGAFYAYKNLVCPCLSIDVRAFINKFITRMNLALKRGNFEDELERFVKEKGPQALEELIANKLKGWETKSVQKEVKTVHVTENIKKEAASNEMESVPLSPQRVSLTGPHIIQTGKEKPETDLVSAGKVDAVENFSETIQPKHVQNIWTCDICQVRTDTEAVLHSHLQGKRHKNACEELIAKTQQAKTKPLVTPGIKEWKEVIPEKTNPGAKVRENRHEASKGPISSEQVSPSENGNNLVVEEIKEISGEAQNTGEEKCGNLVSNQVQNEWACDLCQVKCHSEIILNSHLQGRRHKAACEKLKTGFKDLKTACEEVISICDELKTNTQQAKSEAFQLMDNGNCSTTSSTKSIREPSATVMQLEDNLDRKYVEKCGEKMWRCKMCNVSCSSKISLDDHLNAKKHLNRLKQLECCQA